jgi:tRNA dimethylallyltransferase
MSKQVVILGPTASGKSSVAMAAAQQVEGTHIVAVDAMQVYREMNIGTAKPTAADQQLVPHHCINLVDPSQRFTVTQFQEVARGELAKLDESGNAALLVAGTGLYLTAVIDNLEFPGEWPDVRAELEENHNTTLLFARLKQLDPVAAERIEPTNRRRMIRALEVCLGSGKTFSSFGEGIGAYPPVETVQIGIKWQREALRERIALRVHKMIEAGLVEEVRGIMNEPKGISDTARQALGYKEIIEHIERRWTLEEAIDATILRTQQFAVRQERWYRRDPRIQWVEVQNDPIAEVAPLVVAALA